MSRVPLTDLNPAPTSPLELQKTFILYFLGTRRHYQLLKGKHGKIVVVTIHDHDKDGYDGGSRCNESHIGHHKKAQITKGTMDIEVERKLVFKPLSGKTFQC